MSVLFRDYDLLIRSGLFDAELYVRANPDVAALNIDPLTHYLESGATEGRNPRPDFDAKFYLEQCRAVGEEPANPLLHFVTIGEKRGLKTCRDAGAQGAPVKRPLVRERSSSLRTADGARLGTAELERRGKDLDRMMSVEVPRIVNGAADAPIRGSLLISGWGLARAGVAGIAIAIDGAPVTAAHYGIRRPDVANHFSGWDDALPSGFVANIPAGALSVGGHRVTVTLNDNQGISLVCEFGIEVTDLPDDCGPWSLRRTMSQAEVDLQLEMLERLQWRPVFQVMVPVADGAKTDASLFRTLDSLSRQTYQDWELILVTDAAPVRRSKSASCKLRSRKAASRMAAAQDALPDGFEDLASRIVPLERSGRPVQAASRQDGSHDAAAAQAQLYVMRLLPGDELGCDALLELALATARDRNAEFVYFDDRRPAASAEKLAEKVEACFKPQWSPDLLLSSNYIGRAWAVQAALFKRLGMTPREFSTAPSYHLCLSTTEAAKGILHVPKVLLEAKAATDSTAQERAALRAALRRRDVAAAVEDGFADGFHRVRRKLVTPGLVSIIIPTRGADDRIKDCLLSLHRLTRYSNYEVICIENIPAAEKDAKAWLQRHADKVLHTDEPFNWSRYNNIAARAAAGRFLLFLNDDIEIVEPEWLEAMLEHAQRPEVGVVGAKLLYPDGSVQHAGVMLDDEGRGRHAFRHHAKDDPGYCGLAASQRNVISVTGACLLTRRDTFDALDGFDEEHVIINNDVDFCLRAWRSGLLSVFTPYARLIHHEMISRSLLGEQFGAQKFTAAWGELIARGDPYFNPNLSRNSESFEIEREPVEAVHAGHPLFARESIHRILVLKLDHIGDCLTAIPAVRRLKQLFPAARITVAAGRSTLPVWQPLPEVDEIIEFNFFHARSGLGTVAVADEAMARFAAQLRRGRFDLAVDLRKQPDTRHILEQCGARLRAGYDSQGRFPWLDVALEWDEDVGLRAKRSHVADDLRCLVEAIATQSDRSRQVLAPPAPRRPASARARALLAQTAPFVCIHPAAGSEMRQWPASHFGQLIDLLLDSGKVRVVLIGGPDERSFAEAVLANVASSIRSSVPSGASSGASSSGALVDLVGQLDLSELPSVLSRALLFIGNNSGPQHWAAALGIPTVGIHSGVVDAREWGPLGPRAVALRRRMSCSPCFIERRDDCPRQLACLTGLKPIDVFRRCRAFLPTAEGRRGKGGIAPSTVDATVREIA